MRGKGEDKSMEDLVEISVLGDNLTVSDYPNGRKSTPCLEQLGICTEQLKVDWYSGKQSFDDWILSRGSLKSERKL